MIWVLRQPDENGSVVGVYESPQEFDDDNNPIEGNGSQGHWTKEAGTVEQLASNYGLIGD